MASIDSGGDGGGHKKGPGVKKAKKNVDQGGYDTNGGFGLLVDHLLHIYHNYVSTNGHESFHAKGR